MYQAVNTALSGLRRFLVSGGPFTRPTEMGWQVTTEKGHTAAVSCDSKFCERLNRLEELVALLTGTDARFHLEELHDQGYYDVDAETWGRLVALMDAVGLKAKP
jgi:hypothetical protein